MEYIAACYWYRTNSTMDLTLMFEMLACCDVLYVDTCFVVAVMRIFGTRNTNGMRAMLEGTASHYLCR